MFGSFLLEVSSFQMIDRNGVDVEERGGEEELGLVEGRRNYNQDIFNEKRIFFQ